VEETGQWNKELDLLFSELNTSPAGLSSSEAENRLRKYGHNVIPDKDRKEWLDILRSQFNNPLLIILIVASLVSAYLGDIFDTGIILVIVAISILLGFFQEYKSEKTLTALKKYFRYHATAIRNGEKVQIDAAHIVPGDIIAVGLGDIIPADLRVIETSGITVNESVLTGESREISKSDAPAPMSAKSAQEIKNGLFMGTTVVSGYCRAIAVSTGQNTFFGKTVAVFSAKVPESDFQAEMRKFGSMLFKVIAVLTVFVFLANYSLGHGGENPLTESLLFALALAIGIAPEALPAIVTISLSNGSMHLAEKKVVTKRLAAIEDLGNIDILCTDKTGTLTEGDISVEKALGLDGKESIDVFSHAFLCNAAVGTLRVKGNPIDVAIRKKGLAEKINVSQFKKTNEIPFDFTRRRMGQVVSNGTKTIMIVKGAPESVLAVCSYAKIGDKPFSMKEKAKAISATIAGFGKQGFTTIALASKDVKPKNTFSPDDENGLMLMGFVLLSNPPKHTVPQTLDRLKGLKVRLKILTGDDPSVTDKLCTDLRLDICEKRIVIGHELEGISDSRFSDIVEKYDVFARVTPEQKLRIIEVLRNNGHVVGYLGDGINDAPALRAADVGISVDTAADVAKGASHIILLHKSLSVVADGIEEGRRIFGNITKYILNTMSANQGNMLTVTISSLFLPFIPLLPSQILLNNMVSDLPNFAMPTDKVDTVYTKRPQKWNMKVIINFMIFFGAISTVFDFIFILTMYLLMGVEVAVFRTGWFLESALSEMLIVFSLRTQLPFLRSVPSRVLVLSSVAGALIAVGIVYLPFTQELFHFVPLDGRMLGLIGVVLVAYFAANEIGKTFFFPKSESSNSKGK